MIFGYFNLDSWSFSFSFSSRRSWLSTRSLGNKLYIGFVKRSQFGYLEQTAPSGESTFIFSPISILFIEKYFKMFGEKEEDFCLREDVRRIVQR